jgi:FkbH-like protein
MTLRRSTFVHLLDLTPASAIAIHAVTQMRLPVTREVAVLIAWFDQPRDREAAIPALARTLGCDQATIGTCLRLLLDRGVLTDQPPEAEAAAIVRDLQGHDPAVALDRYRRARMEGPHPYWAVEAPHTLTEANGLHRRLDILLLGDCDVQMETGFLRREAGRRGIDLRAAASFSADIELARDHKHDAIIIGALQARHAVVLGDPEHHDGDPAQVYVRSITAMVTQLREVTNAPILIDGLPEPTVQPLGFADRGIHSHRNRFRAANLALAQLVETFVDVHLVDVAAALNAVGSAALLDDGLVSFTHFGAPGWMLQRPESELAAVHNLFPDMAPLAGSVGGDPYGREAVMARAHMDTLSIVLGLDRKKCVIVDLDGVLWPGVLAETGGPFAWSPEIGGQNSYIGLYFGIHEALRALRRRGILLACVSKNDDATVRALWRYAQPYPRHRLLMPDHFVTTRINWDDKAANIVSIADELGFPPDAFVFVDDSPRERERVRQALPGVTVLGEDLFALRRILLTDPRLQPVRLTGEAASRSDLVKVQLDHARLRASIGDNDAFVASLAVVSTVERPTQVTAEVLQRVHELISRTTQFNATGRAFTLTELRRAAGDGGLFILWMRDRLADHGLVGAAVVQAGAILNLVLSCRVIGLGGERTLLAEIMRTVPVLNATIVATDRNLPVRHVYRDNGFVHCEEGLWRWSRAEQVAA